MFRMIDDLGKRDVEIDGVRRNSADNSTEWNSADLRARARAENRGRAAHPRIRADHLQQRSLCCCADAVLRRHKVIDC